jgi:hypothetical protein
MKQRRTSERINITPKTKVMLDNLKDHPRQSYDEIILNVIGKHTDEQRCAAFKHISEMTR